MIVIPQKEGLLVVTDASQALLAFQLVAHWGNRTTPHPSPLADVLAAVILGKAGFDHPDSPIHLGENGLPLAFEALPAEERELIWQQSILHAGLAGRYIESLISKYFSCLATQLSAVEHARFIAQEQARQGRIRSDLAGEPRYRNAFQSGANETNGIILTICHALSDHLVRGGGKAFRLQGLMHKEESVDLEIYPAQPTAWRVSPWPLIGRRLVVGCEGTLLTELSFSSGEAFQRAWQSGQKKRFSWTLLAPGTAID